MFVDRVKIKVRSGDGGRGIVAFRREKYVPLGGPSGGDGGKGGDIIFQVDTNKSTLLDLRYQKQITATNGQPGKTKKMHGADGQDITVKVPAGTLVFDDENGHLLADLVHANQKVIIAKGGRGGRGNWHFATGRNNAPDYAEQGQLGQAFTLRLELKLLADVGLVGFPSVGKSTLLSVVSAAKPEIADYPFTTIVPNLGVVDVHDGYNFVMADLPGLIEGASQGKGLGDEFLRHIERCKVLVHVLDMSGESGRDPLEDYRIINDELASYQYQLMERPMVVVANKMDGVDAQENVQRFHEVYPDIEVFETITLLNEGLQPLLYRVEELLKETPQFALVDGQEDINNTEFVEYTFTPKEKDYAVEKFGDHTWVIHSPKASHMLKTFDFDLPEHVFRFGQYLKKLGVEQALRDAGAIEGDTVLLDDFQFVFTDELDY